jgi:hypothetical protein
MAMDEKEQRQFIRFLATQWKDCVRELFGYQLFVQYLRQMNFEGIEELLDECRRSPIVQKNLDERLGDLDEMLPPADPDYSDRVKELLAKWKPPGGLPN